MRLSFQNLSKHTLSFFTLIVGATISINQILFLPWPYNHEMESFFRRTLIYADHLKNYDFFPIWSGADNLNHGGPFPLFYHKLFYYFSGIFFNILKSNQESIQSWSRFGIHVASALARDFFYARISKSILQYSAGY